MKIKKNKLKIKLEGMNVWEVSITINCILFLALMVWLVIALYTHFKTYGI